ncbi:hypothetical protein GCM10007359_04490 [Rothia aerolata]|uniref:Uncharacterized protein n=1 Tax=Rothia aerolata TaxID=1812262 RepID=A0A917MQS9_9MICC|nr:hypothetical protein GCM10007359_04490 [Rothia aerolata]
MATGGVTHDHVVAGLKVGDAFANRFYNACSFVAQNQGQGSLIVLFANVGIGLADAGGNNLTSTSSWRGSSNSIS